MFPLATTALPDSIATTATFLVNLLITLILLLLFAGTSTVNAGPLDDATDNWVEERAASEAEDILREIEGDIQLDPNLRNNLKNSVKGFLKDRLR